MPYRAGSFRLSLRFSMLFNIRSMLWELSLPLNIRFVLRTVVPIRSLCNSLPLPCLHKLHVRCCRSHVLPSPLRRPFPSHTFIPLILIIADIINRVHRRTIHVVYIVTLARVQALPARATRAIIIHARSP